MHCYSAITVADQETRKDHLIINREKKIKKKKKEGEREHIKRK
jgi:hypothetical protein